MARRGEARKPNCGGGEGWGKGVCCLGEGDVGVKGLWECGCCNCMPLLACSTVTGTMPTVALTICAYMHTYIYTNTVYAPPPPLAFSTAAWDVPPMTSTVTAAMPMVTLRMARLASEPFRSRTVEMARAKAMPPRRPGGWGGGGMGSII